MVTIENPRPVGVVEMGPPDFRRLRARVNRHMKAEEQKERFESWVATMDHSKTAHEYAVDTHVYSFERFSLESSLGHAEFHNGSVTFTYVKDGRIVAALLFDAEHADVRLRSSDLRVRMALVRFGRQAADDILESRLAIADAHPVCPEKKKLRRIERLATYWMTLGFHVGVHGNDYITEPPLEFVGISFDCGISWRLGEGEEVVDFSMANKFPALSRMVARVL